jgi:hypothetical protein
MIGDADVEFQLAAEAVAELGNAEKSVPVVIAEQSNNDLHGDELSKDASAPATGVSSSKAISFRSVSGERLIVFDLLPPPNPELDGLLKPPEYAPFLSVFLFFSLS